jgi:glyoxylase-like metal-dependent hydrolase (beta-lactamase superfamily II)
VLIAADAAANVFGLALSPMYEDVDEGRRSLSKLAGLEFEVACFGHGKAIQSGASRRFGRKWPAARESQVA